MTIGKKILTLVLTHLAAIVAGAVACALVWHGCGRAKPGDPLVKSKDGKIAVEKVQDKVRYIYITERCPDGTGDTLIVDKSQIREWRLWHKTNNVIIPKYYFGASGKNYGHGAGVEYYRRWGRVGIGGGGYVLAIPGQLTYGVTAGAMIMF